MYQREQLSRRLLEVSLRDMLYGQEEDLITSRLGKFQVVFLSQYSTVPKGIFS